MKWTTSPIWRAIAPGLFLLGFLFIGLHRLFLGTANLPWDATDLYLPWKNFITESLWNGHLPLWNPYIHHGFPQCGDPGTWYPVSWLFALKGRYDVSSMHAEYLFHLWFAGMGTHLLARRLCTPAPIAMALGVCYMFCGLMVGNAQHVGWVVSAAWLPWIMLAMCALFRSPGPAGAAALAFSLAMSLAGGYAGMFIVLAYLLALMFVGGIVLRWRQRRFDAIRSWLTYLLLAVLLFLPAAAAVLVSSFDLSAHVNRGEGMRMDSTVYGILNGSLPINALPTFFLPLLSGVKDPGFYRTDFALVNCTIGLPPIMAVLYGVVVARRMGPVFIVCLLAGVGALLLALGEDLPFRLWVAPLPFMDLFRFPTLFRMFGLLFLVLAAGQVLVRAPDLGRGWPRWLAAGALAMAVVAVVRWGMGGVHGVPVLWHHGVDAFVRAATVADRIFLQALISAVLLAAAAWVARGRVRHASWIFVVLIALDITVAARLSAPDTVQHITGRAAPMDAFVAACPPGHPLPPLHRPLSTIHDESVRHQMPWLWKDLCMIHKLPTGDVHSPYRLLTHDQAVVAGAIDRLAHRALAYWEGTDTTAVVQSTAAAPGLFTFTTQATAPGRLVLLQNTYPGWQVRVNGRPVAIAVEETTFMAVDVPGGVQEVTWRFRPTHIMAGARISMVAWVLLLLYLAWWCLRRSPRVERRRWLAAGGLLVLMAVACVAIGLWQRQHGSDVAARWHALQQRAAIERPGAVVRWVANTDQAAAIPHDGTDVHVVRTTLHEDLAQLAAALHNAPRYMGYLRSGSARWPEEACLLGHGYRTVFRDDRGGVLTMLLERTDQPSSMVFDEIARLTDVDTTRYVASEHHPAIRLRAGDLLPGQALEVFAAASPVTADGPMIVVSVDRPNGDAQWLAWPLHTFGTGPRVQAWAVVDLFSGMRPDQEITIHLWHPGDTPFRMHALHVGRWPGGGAWEVLP